MKNKFHINVIRKINLILITFFLAFLVISCNKSGINNERVHLVNNLTGKWLNYKYSLNDSLINGSHFYFPTDYGHGFKLDSNLKFEIFFEPSDKGKRRGYVEINENLQEIVFQDTILGIHFLYSIQEIEEDHLILRAETREGRVYVWYCDKVE